MRKLLVSRRRWFQFSLRAFLVALTIGCLWLGWTVERARRRRRAIDAIVAAGAIVEYRDDDGLLLELTLLHAGYVNHFWRDLWRVPVQIGLHEMTVDGSIGQLVADAVPIEDLYINRPENDDALRHLTYLNDGCKLGLFQRENATSTAELERLTQRLPKVDIEWKKSRRRKGYYPGEGYYPLKHP